MDAETAVLHLADTLLPGGAGFPAATATGMGPLLLHRLHAAIPGLLAALGPPPATPDAWTQAAARLEAIEPGLFATLRREIYLAYYEQPAVIAAIRALGHPYNDAPLPHGYPTEPFDPAQDTPRHGRGRWIAADDVHRADLVPLDLPPR